MRVSGMPKFLSSPIIVPADAMPSSVGSATTMKRVVRTTNARTGAANGIGMSSKP